jgi:ActR/RegA family two-component response regulator
MTSTEWLVILLTGYALLVTALLAITVSHLGC